MNEKAGVMVGGITPAGGVEKQDWLTELGGNIANTGKM
jgi:hypothetical protein